MVLTDRRIKEALANKDLVIDPSPSEDAYSSTSVDLTLDKPIHVWDKQIANTILLTPGKQGFLYSRLVEKNAQRVELTELGHIMEPGDFVLGWTSESVHLPVQSCIAARVEGKSSLARMGVGVHVTAPTIHSGFGPRPIQLEIFNLGPMRVQLVPGMRVCQLIFELTDGEPEKGYSGQFSGPGKSS